MTKANAKATEKKTEAANVAAENAKRAQDTHEQKERMEIGTAYEKARHGELDVTVGEAIATLAAYFYEPGMVWDRDARAEVSGNTLAFTQQDVLNGMCWTLNQRRQKAEELLDKQRAKVKQMMNQTRGDEVSMVNLSRAIEFGKRVNYQAMAITEMLEHFERAHLAITGNEFVRPKVNAAPAAEAKSIDRKALEADLASLGIEATFDKNDAETQTDGVSQHETEAAA